MTGRGEERCIFDNRQGILGQWRPESPGTLAGARSWHALNEMLLGLDGQPYEAYQKLLGSFEHKMFTLVFDRTQAHADDAPSRIRAIVPWDATEYPDNFVQRDIRAVALADFLSRLADDNIRETYERYGIGAAG